MVVSHEILLDEFETLEVNDEPISTEQVRMFLGICEIFGSIPQKQFLLNLIKFYFSCDSKRVLARRVLQIWSENVYHRLVVVICGKGKIDFFKTFLATKTCSFAS